MAAIVSRPAGAFPAAGAGWHGLACPPSPTCPDGSDWSLGVPEIDRALPAGRLEVAGLHEVKPVAYGDRPAALGFLLALAGRRLRAAGRPDLLWVASADQRQELGVPYGAGLAGLGLDPGAVLIVEARRAADALWAIEEGVRSGAFAAVVGVLTAVAPTPARRLVLAAAEAGTPCLLLTGHASAGSAVAHTRWRVAALRSSPHPLVATVPGPWRSSLVLERCRGRPGGLAFAVEWSDASLRFRLSPALADREAGGGATGIRSG